MMSGWYLVWVQVLFLYQTSVLGHGVGYGTKSGGIYVQILAICLKYIP